MTICLSVGIHKVRLSYRRSLQPSKENIQHFKTWNFLTFSFFVDHFCPPGLDPETRSNADPVPKLWSPDMAESCWHCDDYSEASRILYETKNFEWRKKHRKSTNHICSILSLTGLLLASMYLFCGDFFLTRLLACLERWCCFGQFLNFF